MALINTQSLYFQPSLTKREGPPKQTLDKDDFLKLFLTQLRHQDPEKAQDQSQMMAQMAQFSTLEQMTNMNKNNATANSVAELASASNLIGKTIDVVDAGGNAISGKVDSVRMEKGEARLMVGGKGYKMSEVVSVK